jgi:hypothetical protein
MDGFTGLRRSKPTGNEECAKLEMNTSFPVGFDLLRPVKPSI